MDDIGADTWLMHGSLLGWWWNRRILPWDSDIDVQMSENSMHMLAKYYNMTVYHFQLPEIPKGRDYLLEVNPNYIDSSTEDKHNVIDARWIDTDTGLFIDVTTLRRNITAETLGHKDAMMCKDKHAYIYDEIFPPRDTTFEIVPARIPSAYLQLLVEEYGAQALTNTNYANHAFDKDKMMWIPQKWVSLVFLMSGIFC